MNILKSKFIKNILILASGTSFAQLIVVITTPILTRIYSPEEFGIYGSFISLALIFSTVVNLSYEESIVLPKLNRNAINLTKGSIFFSLVLSILALIGFEIYYLFFDDLLTGFDPIFIWAVPLYMFIFGISKPLANFLIRKREFKILSYANASRSSSMVT